jgi:TolA-binding protein
MSVKKHNRQIAAIVGVIILLIMPALLSAQGNFCDKGVQAYMNKDFKTASRLLREYVKNHPDPYAYYLLGYALYKQNNHAEAAKYFQEAYVLDPRISPILGMD